VGETSGGDLRQDLWEKVNDRYQHAFDILTEEGVQLLPYGKPRGTKGKRVAAQILKDLDDRCLICDELITSTYPKRRAYSIYLSKPNLSKTPDEGEDVMLVQVHEGCVERGAELAAEQGYGLQYRDQRNPSGRA
jgi:hypothetical protein